MVAEIIKLTIFFERRGRGRNSYFAAPIDRPGGGGWSSFVKMKIGTHLGNLSLDEIYRTDGKPAEVEKGQTRYAEKLILLRKSDYSKVRIEEVLEVIGDFLWLVLPEVVQSYYDRGVTLLDERPNSILLVQLRFDDSATDLAILPWELLLSPGSGFALEDTRQSIVRCPSNTDSRRHLSRDGKLGVLIWAPMINASQLGVNRQGRQVTLGEYDTEVDNIYNSLTEAIHENAEVTLLRTGKLHDLAEAVQTGRYQILHYIGHGNFFPAAKGEIEGKLMIPQPSGEVIGVDAEQLGACGIKGNESLHLVFLSSCEGAKGHVSNAYASLGFGLARYGVTVVAMQKTIEDRVARDFASEFYASFACALANANAPSTVDEWLAKARETLRRNFPDTDNWAMPVLYSSAEQPTGIDSFDPRGTAGTSGTLAQGSNLIAKIVPRYSDGVQPAERNLLYARIAANAVDWVLQRYVARPLGDQPTLPSFEKLLFVYRGSGMQSTRTMQQYTLYDVVKNLADTQNRMIIQGDAGVGKTSTLLYLARNFVRPESVITPLFISLRSWSLQPGQQSTLLEYAKSYWLSSRPKGLAINNALVDIDAFLDRNFADPKTKQSLLFLIDDYDRTPQDNLDLKHDEILRFANTVYPAMVVITTRSKDLYIKLDGPNNGFFEVSLSRWSTHQIRSYIKDTEAANLETCLRESSHTASIERISDLPFRLWQLIVLSKDGLTCEQLPQDPTSLTQQFLDKILSGEPPSGKLAQIRTFLQRISHALATDGVPGGYLPYSDALREAGSAGLSVQDVESMFQSAADSNILDLVRNPHTIESLGFMQKLVEDYFRDSSDALLHDPDPVIRTTAAENLGGFDI